MPVKPALIPLSIALLVLAACHDASPPTTQPVPDAPSATPAPVDATPDQAPLPPEPAAVESPTVGGDGSAITLLPLEASQLANLQLPGELACSLLDPSGGTLLLARADVVADGMVRAAINHNGYVEVLANGRAGGFNDLADGITLAGKGLSVVLARGAAQPTGDESTAHAATLTVQRADGAQRVYPGTLRCGP